MRKILLLAAILFIQCFVLFVNAQEIKVKSREIPYSLSDFSAVMLYTSKELAKNETYSGKINRVVTQCDNSEEVIIYLYTDKGRFEVKPFEIETSYHVDEKRNDLFYALTVAEVDDVIIWSYDGYNITLKPLKLSVDNKKK